METLLKEAAAAVAAFAADPPWWVAALLALAAVVLLVRYLKRALPRLAAGREGLTAAHLAITGAVGLAAAVLIGFAFAMSYASLYKSATWLEHTPFGDLRWMFPIGIDAVIVFFLALDLVMEWQGRPHPLARWSAYALSGVTILLNVGQTGDGEGLVGALGHAGPPVVIILISEAVAAWVRHMAGMLHGELPDRIPTGRWIAQPVSTLLVARLMLGWGVTSYHTALKLESARQYARSMLRQQYGWSWRRRTPRHVLWMLANGRDLPTALRLVDALTPAVPKTAEQAREQARQAAGEHPVSPAATAVSPAPGEDGTPGPEGDGWSVGDVLAAELTQYLAGRDTSPWDTPGDGEGDTLTAGTGHPVPQGDTPAAGADTAGPRNAEEGTEAPWWQAALADEGTPREQQGQSEGTPEGDGGGTGDTDRDALARRILRDQPTISVRNLAKELGCSKTQADRIRTRIREEQQGTPSRPARDTRGDTGGGEGR